ncbi:unnamed protein product [Caenorhabditis sp. 36 PRJEB53466]|nr:unnamed protein product [Caenorhabditis sp. 36 PRJEB53466]
MVWNLCTDCRRLNRAGEAEVLDDEYQELRIKMCRICRSHINHQRRIKYFKFDVLVEKRRLREPTPSSTVE